MKLTLNTGPYTVTFRKMCDLGLMRNFMRNIFKKKIFQKSQKIDQIMSGEVSDPRAGVVLFHFCILRGSVLNN